MVTKDIISYHSLSSVACGHLKVIVPSVDCENPLNCNFLRAILQEHYLNIYCIYAQCLCIHTCQYI